MFAYSTILVIRYMLSPQYISQLWVGFEIFSAVNCKVD
jgi:hypothetical protein